MGVLLKWRKKINKPMAAHISTSSHVLFFFMCPVQRFLKAEFHQCRDYLAGGIFG